MEYQSQLIERRIYSLELRHKICKEHIEDGVAQCDLVRKYNLSCHSLIHSWLRKLGYLPGFDRRSSLQYICSENYTELKKGVPKAKNLTAEQLQIEQLKKELADVKIVSEGYRRMIEVAEKELNIPIRKKLNTK